jgi:hypothetical protein
MDEFARMALCEHEAMRIARRQRFWMHFTVWAAFSVFLFVLWLLTTRGFPWFGIPIMAWGIGVAAHWAQAYVVRDPEEILMLREQRSGAFADAPAGPRVSSPAAGAPADAVRAPSGTAEASADEGADTSAREKD